MEINEVAKAILLDETCDNCAMGMGIKCAMPGTFGVCPPERTCDLFTKKVDFKYYKPPQSQKTITLDVLYE